MIDLSPRRRLGARPSAGAEVDEYDHSRQSFRPAEVEFDILLKSTLENDTQATHSTVDKRHYHIYFVAKAPGPGCHYED